MLKLVLLTVASDTTTVLQGLSPQQNRTVPPLRYAWVYALKRDFPHLQFRSGSPRHARSSATARTLKASRPRRAPRTVRVLCAA